MILLLLLPLLWQLILTPAFAQTETEPEPEPLTPIIDPDPVATPTPLFPQRWSLELPLTFPEGFGASVAYQGTSWLSIEAFYHLPTPIRVKATIKSRKLLDREGFIIRSPNIDLPFSVKLGPHQGVGARFEPFARPFYMTVALEKRIVTIDTLVQSHLEVIDSQSRTLTNTLFQASASTRTEQTLLRSTLGYRWDIGETAYFFSLFSGWSRPLAARSSVQTQVRVRNPEASNPGNVDARNLQDAEAQQERVIHQKLVDELRKIETVSLPVLGISFGKYL